MSGDSATEGGLVVERVAAAMNAHDIEALVACFEEDYRSIQPAHPDRAFGGRVQVRENWSEIFRGVPDFAVELVRAAADGDVEWSEWRWRGVHADGTPLDMAGVIVAGVRAGRLAWARLYVEHVEHGGAGIRAAVREMAGGAGGEQGVTPRDRA